MEDNEQVVEFCLFCFKSVEEFPTSNEQTDIYKFLALLKRYLESELPVKRDDEESSRNGVLFRDMFIGRCCKDCYQIVVSFCDLYCQMKHLELMINWNMKSLINIMSAANQVDSRVEMFRNSFTIEDCSVEGGACFENVWTWRNLLISNCARKLHHSYPRLAIKRCDEDDSRFSVLSMPVSVDENSQLLNSTSTSLTDDEAIIARNVEIPSLPLEQINSTSEEDNLEQSKMEFENNPDQNISPTVDDLVIRPSSVESCRKKTKLPKKKIKNYHRINFRCGKCPRIFSTRIQLKYHKQSHYQRARTKPKIPKLVKSPLALADDNENSNISNPSDPITSQEKELFQKKSLPEPEENSDNVTRVDFELSDCNLDNLTRSKTISSAINNPETWKTSPTPKSTVIHLFRTLYICEKCWKISNNKEKHLLHKESHLQLEIKKGNENKPAGMNTEDR